MAARTNVSWNVNPRHGGSPALVDEATARRVIWQERKTHLHDLSGRYGDEERERAQREGIHGVVEMRTEHHDGWNVVDMITGRRCWRGTVKAYRTQKGDKLLNLNGIELAGAAVESTTAGGMGRVLVVYLGGMMNVSRNVETRIERPMPTPVLMMPGYGRRWLADELLETAAIPPAVLESAMAIEEAATVEHKGGAKWWMFGTPDGQLWSQEATATRRNV